MNGNFFNHFDIWQLKRSFLKQFVYYEIDI